MLKDVIETCMTHHVFPINHTKNEETILKLSTLVGASVTLLVATSSVHAVTSYKESAVALAQKAVAHAKKNGVETACKDFADPRGGFIQGELYVFVQDMQAKMICHATNAKLNGKDLSSLKDVDGKFFSKDMATLAKTKGNGWVEYQWVNPVTKVIEPKASYVEKVDDNTWLGVGIYRK